MEATEASAIGMGWSFASGKDILIYLLAVDADDLPKVVQKLIA